MTSQSFLLNGQFNQVENILTDKKESLLKKRKIEHSSENMVEDNANYENLNRTCNWVQGPSRSFLPLQAGGAVFQTESWKGKDTSYSPITEDTLLNARLVEQFTFSSGLYFIADNSGNYSSTVAGNVIHLWKYNTTHQKMTIHRSLLFTTRQLFEEAKSLLLQL